MTDPTAPHTGTAPPRAGAAREALCVWLASIAATGLFGLLAQVVPFVAENLLAFIAGVFLYLPAWALWRRHIDLSEHGLRAAPVGKGLAVFAVCVAAVLPPFAVGYDIWHSRLFGRSLALERERLVRFSRDLDDRPEELFPDVGSLHVFIEGEQLMMLWSGEGRVEAVVELDPAAPAFERLHGFRPAGERLVSDHPLGGVKRDGGRLEWSRQGPGGIGFSLAGVESFRVETGSGELVLGRYGVRADSPLEAERSAWWWLWMLGVQLILVAVPEEWFYRGYLQQRLDDAFAPRWRLLGARLGFGWLVSSALFAAGHLVLDPRPSRLAVFFPSLLFGWMKARTGSILAPSLFHAVSNVFIQALAYARA